MHLCWLVVLFLFCFFFHFVFLFFSFFYKKVVPTSNEVSFFILWVSPWTVEGQGLWSHRQLEEKTLHYAHSNPNKLIHTSTPGVHAVSTHTTHMTHGADTHTHIHTEETWPSCTHSNLGRPQGQRGTRGTDKLSIGLVSVRKHPDLFYRCDTHQQTVKYTSHERLEKRLCYIHLAQQ